MAEPPQEIYSAVFRDGYEGRGGKAAQPPGAPVPAPALLLLSMLWGWVDWNWRRRPEVPLFVFPSLETLATRRNLGTRAIEEQLRQLIAAKLIVRGMVRGNRGFFLSVPASPGQVVSDDNRVNVDRSMDRRSPIHRAPAPINGSEISDPLIGGSPINGSGDLRSIDHRYKEELASELASERARELGGRAPSPRELARQILASAIPPDGLEALGSSAVAERNLAQLLAEGEPPDVVRAVLAAAPDLVARGKQPARWYGPETFTLGVWPGWRRAWNEARREAETEAVRAEAQRSAAEQARAEQAARAREARMDYESMLARLEPGDEPPTLEHMASPSARYLEVLRRAPDEARRAAAKYFATEASPTTAGARLAVARVELPEPVNALELIRSLREEAQREGRELTVDEFNAAIVQRGRAEHFTPQTGAP